MLNLPRLRGRTRQFDFEVVSQPITAAVGVGGEVKLPCVTSQRAQLLNSVKSGFCVKPLKAFFCLEEMHFHHFVCVQYHLNSIFFSVSGVFLEPFQFIVPRVEPLSSRCCQSGSRQWLCQCGPKVRHHCSRSSRLAPALLVGALGSR